MNGRLIIFKILLKKFIFYIEICNLTVYNTKKISYLQFKLSENLIFYEEYY